MLAPVIRPLPAFVAVDRVSARIMAGAILHDPEGRYTVGHYTDPGSYALFAWTDRADHSREKVWTTDEYCPEGRYTLAARAFVAAVGVESAMVACRAADERGPWA